MTLRRHTGWLVLVAVVALATAGAPDAALRIFRRFVVLSWDSPATQLSDELAGGFSPPSDAGDEARQWSRLACRPTGRLALDAAPPVSAAPALGATGSRAPPAAA